MAAHPGCEMTVLCGHTHSPGEASILPNLRVLTAGADYGRPVVQRILVAEGSETFVRLTPRVRFLGASAPETIYFPAIRGGIVLLGDRPDAPGTNPHTPAPG